MAHGRYILIPTSDETRGHGTHSRAGGVEEISDRTAEGVGSRTPRCSIRGASIGRRAAPAEYQVKIATSAGDFTIEAHRDWAPRGADRFYNLVRAGFYDDSRFFA